jgi:hypothetical protein
MAKMIHHSIRVPCNEVKRSTVATHYLRRIIIITLMTVYCLAIFFGLDCVYSNFFYTKTAFGPAYDARIADRVFHHTLAPNYSGYEGWGDRGYHLITNSLGFKDAAVRNISLTTHMRRVVLIGDSMTEGIGIPFEETFAGLLAEAGQQRAEKTEFLNAAVQSYSPTIYYRKIKFLLDSGLKFDEVLVLPDLSDVRDEATSYFCFDDNPQYATLCRLALPPDPIGNEGGGPAPTKILEALLSRNFRLSDKLRQIIKFKLWVLTGKAKRQQTTPSPLIGWTVPNYEVGNAYAPLGVEGGIRRAIAHMHALSELPRRRSIPLTVAVYPWPLSLVQDDPAGRWVTVWRDFCTNNCKSFINMFPDFVAARDAHPNWYERYFIIGDLHFSAEGHKIAFQALTRNGL